MILIDFINEVAFEVVKELLRKWVAGMAAHDDVEDDGEVIIDVDGCSPFSIFLKIPKSA